ncbi:MAG: bifunctional (p)ppGpp synthetase/guanosine-3',5'-bis(diphosphate) 3'-pyrophosphohydrolase [Candidatus Obscuribacterales bacterium]|nr:bifunctional (p)ppGpp synthetase/guanosine-3',5'-bis(diphosphate) 3'-pyrophosphohydrolase [Steroidobacteraceae bacterium]
METATLEPRPNSPALQRADAFIATLPVTADEVTTRARALAHIVATLGAEDEVVLGTLLYPLLDAGALKLDAPDTVAVFGAQAIHIARESIRIGSFGNSSQWQAHPSLSSAQAESLRKMLLAIAADPRLVLVRLADQLHRLRDAKNASETEQQRLALETREIYAPLANRLGIWQLKWELEDLGFRYLDPDNYKRIAGLLAAKRVDRERYIDNVKQQLKAALYKAGIAADIAGRPKHIYSIWRKMQRKGLSFEQLYDVRAVRVLVGNLADCYAALGVVHGMWPFIPGEFDDYIATPKDNLYRSLHTAVIGPEKLPLEVQIRTREMHEHAELGVAAHWTYKEGSRTNPAYQQKINWLRQLIEPTAGEGEASETDNDFLERVRAEVFEDRVYALSPRGEVVELPQGATPLDYAYHVHTELGHRCRGAKVNGRMVPLDFKLTNGDQVEIVTAKHASPSRDWLAPSLGFLASQRNRSKVRAWFRKQDEDQNRLQGKQMLERELQRLAIHSVTLPELIGEFDMQNAAQLYLALGEGELTIPQITGAIQRRVKPQDLPTPTARRARVSNKETAGVTIDGVGDLLSSFAKCCRPVPPEIIAGYITLGRGVSIHRRDCASLRRLETAHSERVINVAWGHNPERTFTAAVQVKAFDRRGIVRDVSAVLSDLHINIQAMNSVTHAQDGIVDMTVGITVHDLGELSQVLSRIQGLPNVISARRKT